MIPLLGMVLPGWAKYAAIGIAAVALVAFGWVKGNNHGTAKLDRYVAQQAVASQKLAERRQAITERIVVRWRERQAATKVVTETIEKEVIRYADANPSACLDADFRRLHDSAALGQVPGPAAGAATAPGAAEALATVTQNYAACIRTAQRLTALQEWVTEQRKVE